MPITIDDEILRDARVLWEYHHLDLELEPADFVLALGSHDIRVAAFAAGLVLQGYAPLLVTSGALGKVTAGLWNTSEGERFAEIARDLGVPDSQVLVEDLATNTGENIIRTRELLLRKDIRVKSGILVTKPYMRRRAYATAAKQWPEVNWLVASPELSFEDYPSEDVPLLQMIELMVGDLQRIRKYGENGFQIHQDVPVEVWESYNRLVHRGFDKYVIGQRA